MASTKLHVHVTYAGLNEALTRCLEAHVHAAMAFDYAMRVADETQRNERLNGLQQIFQDAVNLTKEVVDNASKYIAEIAYPADAVKNV